MQPIQELLHRIRWDPEFGKGTFAIGYRDRVAARDEIVSCASVDFDPEDHDLVLIPGPDGETVHLPLHRIRVVYKNGVAIWRRPGPPLPPS